MENHDGEPGPFYRGVRPSTSVDVDAALALLSNRQRRSILRYLVSTPEDSVTIDAIAEHIAEEMDIESKSVKIDCHHTHLPKLNDSGVIDYDQRMGDVRYNRTPTVEHLLDAIADVEN